MLIYLMNNPWAASPSHTIEADGLPAWRQAVAAIPPGQRYSVAVAVGDDPRPRPVQWFSGVEWDRGMLSADGFLVVRTGLPNADSAAKQWDIISDFPRVFALAQQSYGDIGGFTRQALYPRPKLTE